MELCAFKRNNFILNKLIPCLIIIMFAFMCLYGSSVYATIDFTYNNEEFSFPDLPTDYITPNYYYIYYDDASWLQNHFFLVCSENEMTVSARDANLGRVASSSTIYCYTYISNDNCWVFSANINNSDSVRAGLPSRLRYSSYDIYNSGGDLVFQAPPQGQAPIIAGQVEEVEMDRTLSEITGILPIVLVVIVGLIAIRKAIQFLMTTMKGA